MNKHTKKIRHDYSERVLLQKSFVAGTYPLTRTTRRLWKLEGGAIFICRQGSATVNIDLQDYEIGPDTGALLLPGSLFRVERLSEDFTLSLFGFTPEMFHEAAFRLETDFFRFLKQHPCGAIPGGVAQTTNSLMQSISSVFADHQNTHRDQIARLLLRSLLLNFYDKTHRYFDRRQAPEKNSRTEELLHKFTALIHDSATSERDVGFYADKLCISPKYLTSICRRTVGRSAKEIIDHHVLLEIKVLLQSTELSIQEISDRLHFPDQSYLGRYFKRHEGISPKDYRAGCRSLTAATGEE